MTVEQSLSDIATFINAIRTAHNGRYARVILWGSGYGATLATWARKRYPHLVDAVWSSSGIFEIEAFTFSQYDLLQYVIYDNGGEECRDLVLSVFRIFEYLIEQGNGEYIQSRLNLCTPVDVTSSGDIGAVYQSHIQAIIDYFAVHQ